ncbi:MAG: hypothetical protein Q9Q13_10215 [Acidobacteriota bacterium]|nr:hypothetical protein [Acidobacteriota bacterium]
MPPSRPAAAGLELDLDLVENVTSAPASVKTAGAAPAAPAPVDLDLDLDLAPPPVPATPQEVPVIPPEPSAGADSSTVRDLFDAAEGLDQEIPVEEFQPRPESAAVEEPPLVGQARQALEEGRLADAMELASRAMATDENAPGADEVLESARRETQRRAEHAESLLVEGLAAMENGNDAEAIPLFEQALELVPDHPEITEALERARGLVSAPAGNSPSEELNLESIESIPLAAAPPAQAAPEATAAQATPTEDLPAAAPPPPPPPGDEPAGCQVEPGTPPVEREDPGVPGPPAPDAGRPGPRVGSVRAAGSRRWLPGLLLVVATGAAGWYGYDWWRGQQEPVAGASAAPSRSAPSAPVPDASATVSTESPAARQDREEPAPAPQAPVYTARDVPRLMARARRLLAQGKESEAVELLVAAQHADPTSFDVVEQLENARRVLRERQRAEERIAIGKDAFHSGSYEEALRIFYRVPKAYQPPGLERWIANGWYNLGVRSLQAGDVVEAARFFADGLELMPDDADAQRNRELARRYRRRGLDDAYRLYVSRLTLRALED